MNLDDKIKQALKMDAEEVERVLSHEKGLYSQLFGIFRGNMKYWNMYGMCLAIVTAVCMIWSGYHFFVSETQENRLFWGVIFLGLWVGTMGIKVWFWLEMNRYTSSREIKRLELAVTQLTAKIEKK